MSARMPSVWWCWSDCTNATPRSERRVNVLNFYRRQNSHEVSFTFSLERMRGGVVMERQHDGRRHSTAEQKMVLDKDIHAMSRNEVILAVQECESSGLRAVMVFGKRKINNHTADVVADVTCAPKYRY